MEKGTVVQVREFGGEWLVRVVIGSGPGVCYVASERSAEAVGRGERGAIGFPLEDVTVLRARGDDGVGSESP